MDRLDLNGGSRLASLAALVRLALYRAPAASRAGGDEAAAAVGISRKLAAYHLDKLAEAGCSRSASSAAAAAAGPVLAGRQRSTCAPPARSRSPCQPGNYQLIAELLADAQADPRRARAPR